MRKLISLFLVGICIATLHAQNEDIDWLIEPSIGADDVLAIQAGGLLKIKLGTATKVIKLNLLAKFQDSFNSTRNYEEKELLSPRQDNGKWGFANKDAAIIINPIYDKVSEFTEEYALVYKNKSVGFVDKTGREIVPLIFEDAKNFSNGLAAVKLNGKWGILLHPKRFEKFKITQFVNAKMLAWQSLESQKLSSWQKPYPNEKLAEFQERMKGLAQKTNEYKANFKIYLDKVSEQAFDKYETRFVYTTAWQNIEVSEYDAENETFTLAVDGNLHFVLQVPPQEAIAFKKINLLEFRNKKIILTDSGWRVQSMNIVNIVSNKSYAYDAKKVLGYAFSHPVHLSISIPELNYNQSIQTENIVQATYNLNDKLPLLKKNPNLVAVVIGNKDYANIEESPFSLQDVRLFRRYLLESFAVDADRILYYENANLNDLFQVFGRDDNPYGKLYSMVQKGKTNLIIYFSGRGATWNENQQNYLLPVDANKSNIDLSAFALHTLQNNVSMLGAKTTTFIIESSFTPISNAYAPFQEKTKYADGGVLELSNALLVNGGTVLSATSKDQSNLSYNDARLGLFTFNLLKAIHNKNADANKDNKLSFQEWINYINDSNNGLSIQALRLGNGLKQNPVLESFSKNAIFIEYP